jgi:hypothetical protein
MNLRLISLFIILLVSLSGCKNLALNAGKKIENAFKELTKMLEDKDFVGLPTLIADNKELAATIQKLQARLNADMGTRGMLVLNNRRIRIRVDSFTGEWKLNSFTNTAENTQWDGKIITEMDDKLFKDGDSFTRALAKDRITLSPIINYDKVVKFINQEYVERTSKVFVYEKPFEPIILGEQLGNIVPINKLTQAIVIKAKPIRANKANRFSLRIVLEVENEDKSFDLLKDINFSDVDYKLNEEITKQLIFYTDIAATN